MPAPAFCEALRLDAERRLRRYRIEPLGCRFVVIRKMAWNQDHDERAFPDQEAAEQYLFGKLPAIDSEL